MKKLLTLGVGLATAGLLLTGCGTGNTAGGATTLTFWVDGACPTDGTCYYDALVKAFEAENPDIDINIVEQPSDSYFLTLKSSSISKQGPDLATVWPGAYLLPIKQYLADAKQWVPEENLSDSAGLNNYAEGGSIDNAIYALPSAGQWYCGYYNKALLADAGIDAAPTTWDELFDAAAALKANGVLPISEGGGESGAHFQVAFEWSYLLAALPASDWNKLLDGTLPYSNPTVTEQLEKWQSLYTEGFVNEDAYNSQTSYDEFKSGGAGMMLGSGSWKASDLAIALGDDLGVFALPFSDEPQSAIVQTPGEAVAVTNYGKNQDAAGKFVAFMMSDEGQQAIASTGSPGTRPGSAPPAGTPGSEQATALLEMTSNSDTTIYPMFDNLMQSAVWDVVSSEVSLVLVGERSVDDALASVDAAVKTLPADELAVNYNIGK
jgi:raffinose/stachyose/melibiose transport system substrate-binding protein